MHSMSAAQSIHAGPHPAALAGGVGERFVEGAGGATAQQRLLQRVWPDRAASLAALAVGMGLDRERAADVLQDVYLTALRRPPPIDDETELARWLFRVTANRCRQEHRRRSRWRRAWRSLAAIWQGDGHAASLPIGTLRREVDAALAKLADDDRLLVVLRYFVDLNSRQIAEFVEQPESTVRGRLRAARQRLARELAEWNEHE
jgi:RNA polymerase sigma-70 factor, ECF subfamily